MRAFASLREPFGLPASGYLRSGAVSVYSECFETLDCRQECLHHLDRDRQHVKKLLFALAIPAHIR